MDRLGKVKELMRKHNPVDITRHQYLTSTCTLKSIDYRGFSLSFIESKLTNDCIVSFKFSGDTEASFNLKADRELIELINEAIDKFDRMREEKLDKRLNDLLNQFEYKAAMLSGAMNMNLRGTE